MKKTLEADYADDKVIDLRQLDHVRFDAGTKRFTWTGATRCC